MLIIESSNHLSSLCAGKSFLGYWNGLEKKFALGSRSNLDEFINDNTRTEGIIKIITPTFLFKFEKIKNVVKGEIMFNFIDIDPIRNTKYKRTIRFITDLKKV